jgi:hypothetical protein
MKRLFGIACALIFLAACTNINGARKNDNGGTLKRDSVTDSMRINLNGHDISSTVKIVVPVGNEALNKSIRRFLVESVEGDDKLNSLQSMAHHFVALKTNELKEDVVCDGTQDFCPPLSFDMEIGVIYENEKIVTLCTIQDIYLGGAHGSYLYGGTTFRKSDGVILDDGILKKSKIGEVKKEVSRRLAEEYFKRDNDEDSPMMENGVLKTVDLPGAGVYIDNDSMVFTYQQYEIAAYVFGLPTVSIPLKEMKEKGWLNDNANW